MKKNKGGRPTLIDESIVKKLEEAYQLDCSMTEIAFWCGVPRQTLYNWKKKDTKLFDKLEALRSKPIMIARKTLISGITTNPELALKYLERKRRSEFSTKITVDGDISMGMYEVNDEVYKALEKKMKQNTDFQKNLLVDGF